MQHSKIELIKGDITTVIADAIVNAANSSLMGGGGVDGAIHRTGGPAILEACEQIVAKHGQCKTGEAVITNAGNLRAKYVIHTVGPVWQGGEKKEGFHLAACYRNSLALAVENKCTSIAFPNISTGVYHYPKTKAADVALATVRAFLDKDSFIQKVIFVCFDTENYEIMLQLLRQHLPDHNWPSDKFQ